MRGQTAEENHKRQVSSSQGLRDRDHAETGEQRSHPVTTYHGVSDDRACAEGTGTTVAEVSNRVSHTVRFALAQSRNPTRAITRFAMGIQAHRSTGYTNTSPAYCGRHVAPALTAWLEAYNIHTIYGLRPYYRPYWLSIKAACDILSWMHAAPDTGPKEPQEVVSPASSAAATLGARVTLGLQPQGSETGRNRPPLPLGVRFRVVQAVSLKSHVVGSPSLEHSEDIELMRMEAPTFFGSGGASPRNPANEDSTCSTETSEAQNPNPNPNPLLMLLMWIVHPSRSYLEVERWLVGGVCGGLIRPRMAGDPKRVSAWFFKGSEDSHSGKAVGVIIKRVQLIIDELQVRAQENGDNQIDYLRPKCFEVSCIVIVYKRNQALGTVSSCSSRSIRHRDR